MRRLPAGDAGVKVAEEAAFAGLIQRKLNLQRLPFVIIHRYMLLHAHTTSLRAAC